MDVVNSIYGVCCRDVTRNFVIIDKLEKEHFTRHISIFSGLTVNLLASLVMGALYDPLGLGIRHQGCHIKINKGDEGKENA